MYSQFLTQLSTSLRQYVATEEESNSLNAAIGSTVPIEGISVLEIAPESNSRICTHSGESGKVYADTRVRMPARFRVRIAVPESTGRMSPALENLLNASAPVMCRYACTGYFSKCLNMVVSHSRHRDTTEVQGLREQDIVLEEVFEYDKQESPVELDDSDTKQNQLVVFSTDE